MHKEDLEELKAVEEILEREIRAESKKITDAGVFSPGQTKVLCDAVCLMLKMKEYEEWLEGKGISEYSQRNYARGYSESSYAPPRSTITGRFVSHGMMPSYEMGYSGHSTKDRMISRLEDMMGEAKNEYEAQMIRDTIMDIQNRK